MCSDGFCEIFKQKYTLLKELETCKFIREGITIK